MNFQLLNLALALLQRRSNNGGTKGQGPAGPAGSKPISGLVYAGICSVFLG